MSIKNKKPVDIESNGKETKSSPAVVASISPPNWKAVKTTIIGTSPYVQSKFTQKAKQQMRDKMTAGKQAAVRKKDRDPRDFKADYEGSRYTPIGEDWEYGAIPATQIRAAMISAGRLIDFTMTLLKQLFYVEHQGVDVSDRIPLIPITKGKPKQFEQALPNTGGGHDIRVRPMWEEGWQCDLTIRYDADRITGDDVINLLSRAGEQVGIGEGRMASRKCSGVGWGAFRVMGSDDLIDGDDEVVSRPKKKKMKVRFD